MTTSRKAGKRIRMAAMPRRIVSSGADADLTLSQDVVLPLTAIALHLAAESGDKPLIYIAADDRRAEEIGRLLQTFASQADAMVFPAWDCLPFDRASPSRESMGRRMAVVDRLCQPAQRPRIVVTTVDAAMQRVPPVRHAAERYDIRTGHPLDLAALKHFANRTGYVASDRVDEHGEIEFHGQVVEVFRPEDTDPVRVEIMHGVVKTMHRYDPATQRSGVTLDEVRIGPASEIVFAADATAFERPGGFEHKMAGIYHEHLPSLFDVVPEAVILSDPGTESRRSTFLAMLQDAHGAQIPGSPGAHRPPYGLFYVDQVAWTAVLGSHEEREIVSDRFLPVPDFAAESKPVHAFQSYCEDQRGKGRRVVLSGVRRDLTAFARYLERHGGEAPHPVKNWETVRGAAAGTFFSLDLDLDEGIVDEVADIVLIAAADVLGTRAHRASLRETGRALLMPPAIRVGDTVIHEDHGIGVLRSLERVEIDGQNQDAVRLDYHGGNSILMPVVDFDKLWRYGSDEEAVPLDRLHTDAWARRRIGVVKALIETAGHLVALAADREAFAATKLVAPQKSYEAFSTRFLFPETPDQNRAIKAVLDDMASGRQMDRLVCGDVGFGKTEVALRAAAVALLNGKQVALVAPTTVLARQHLETFRRRFADFDVAIAGLSRLDSAAEAKRVKQGLADGTIDLVIGTHAVAGHGVTFADLGLVIIDEEQKFGAKIKAELRGKATGCHVLTMTATPIPRTLQMAMVGIQAVSVIATPPVRRRPIRTFASVFDPASVRIALMREHARGGQSFVIVPRIEDIAILQRMLSEIVPDLQMRVAHGELPAEEADKAMVGFAEGQGDILLATNIVESGLDVPRANTMLVWHADRFGLSQLHQLRGRVGRGRTQGICYLLSDPETPMGDAARARLATLQSFDRLGSGFEISARDLDLRGAGDLVGDDQAGHMRLIGLGLYQNLLSRAVRQAKGEVLTDDSAPEVNLGIAGHIPERYVAEPDLRLDLYARLSRFETAKEIAAFEEEVEDRFGVPPIELKALLASARVRGLCRRLHVAALTAGPRGIALTFRPEGLAIGEAAAAKRADLSLKGSRLVCTRAAEPNDGMTAVEELLEFLISL